MGVERIHACPNVRGDTFKDLDKCPVCSASRYENNAGYCSGDNHGPADRNKRKRKGATISVSSVEPADTTLGTPRSIAEFLPWLCGTSQFPIALGVSSRSQRMLS